MTLIGPGNVIDLLISRSAFNLHKLTYPAFGKSLAALASFLRHSLQLVGALPQTPYRHRYNAHQQSKSTASIRCTVLPSHKTGYTNRTSFLLPMCSHGVSSCATVVMWAGALNRCASRLLGRSLDALSRLLALLVLSFTASHSALALSFTHTEGTYTSQSRPEWASKIHTLSELLSVPWYDWQLERTTAAS